MDQSVMDRYIDEMQKMYKIAKAKDPNYVTAATTPALPGTGYLVMQVTTMRSTYPVQGAKVTVYQGDYADGNIVAQETTDENGKTKPIPLATPAKGLSEQPEDESTQVYSSYNVLVDADGYVKTINKNLPVFDGVTSLQAVDLLPVSAAGGNTETRVTDEYRDYSL